MRDSRIYSIWKGIKRRCNNKNDKSFDRYGGKGIKCEWLTATEFINDMHESYLRHVEEFGERQTTIDRIDSGGNYCKTNCKWSTLLEQSRNRKYVFTITIGNKQYSIKELSEKSGINKNTLREIVKNNWDIKYLLEQKKHVGENKFKNSSPKKYAFRKTEIDIMNAEQFGQY